MQQRLEPIEREALATTTRLLQLIKFHLSEGTANQDEVRAALIEASGILSDIPEWIAEDTGLGFASYIASRLIAVAPAMERIAADDSPEPDWENLCEERRPEPPDEVGDNPEVIYPIEPE